ncbi:uncharacterized protein PHACADRAFT_252935 [Phanerochaete carnosa HHB-10118-sp]|uniref:Calcium-transporting ATPase n=1 Tax=Phanerochaete carnosa (strain HHB-10118-sp) TaxID=650164 RepID=K5WGS0_PHACS|nr:uncharacterized protein PHACADRAFT_252935 [Phanerochaete carnosa HHB-10118-sp]EKM58525.1 hypothetical protein PHACADRAFT_252935 [Phanerochaete carnosa HHB-10118-sp]
MSTNNSADNLNQLGDSELGIPSIQVTTDLSTPRLTLASPPDVGSSFSDSYSPLGSPPYESRSRSPSEQGLLSPVPILRSGRPSLDVPSSPTGSSWGSDGSTHVPPSPTLSTASSVHFANQTTLALRDNNPSERSGLSSLHLLSVNGHGHGHARKNSNASTLDGSTEGTEPDSHSIGMATLVPTLSPTPSQTSSVGGTTVHEHERSSSHLHFQVPERKDKGEEHDEAETETERPVLDLTQDEGIDPTPFAFKPYQLASLVDPKNLSALTQMGGTDGLLKGLGTHPKHGLPILSGSSHVDIGKGKKVDVLGDGRPGTGTPPPGAGDGASQRHDRIAGDAETGAVPGIMVIGDDGEAEEAKMEGLEPRSEMGHIDAHCASRATLEDRHRVFGENVLPSRKTKSLLQLMWLALKDKVLVLLSIAAIVSLALGFFQDFGTPRPADEPPVDWVEGVAIIIAIFIVVMVGSLNDWQKERQFQVLNEKKEERGVKVIRGGVERVIDIHDVVVGDVALVEPGEIVPCDGVFLSGHNVRCDESGATGESDAIRKLSYEECVRAHEKGDASAHADCFMVSGSKVLEGYGSYVVITVGTKSFNGRIMMALRGDTENTPLQLKLNDLAELIAKLGSAAGLLLFTALMIRFFVQLGTNNPQRTSNQKGIAFVQILIISVTLIVVAVPEGLPLAVTLALAFATKRMTKEKLLVRVLGSCETMANASVVCTDKTGTLTQNEMTIVAGSLGIHCKFVHQLEQNKSRTNAGEEAGVRPSDYARRKHAEDFSIDQTELNHVLSDSLKELLNASIAINSTAFEDEHPDTGAMVFVGSKTETALLNFAKENGWADYKKTREEAAIEQMIPFSSERKAMGVVVRLHGGRYRLFLKGASEILTRMCTRHIVVANPNGTPQLHDDIETREIDELANENIQRTIIFYANQTLRTIAICYRDFESWPPKGVHVQLKDEVPYDILAQDLTLIGIVGIEDPLRPGVRDAVAMCQKAGVAVKMCTGDNVLTARSIALQCGIYTAGGIIMEGPVFRQLNDPDMLELVPRLQVLARSSPEDKKLLVEKLKELGEIVGVTGDGTNDGPALKTADVGFSMGIAGTEVAKEASDIILMDDNFSSIVKAIMWGRCVNDAVRKFLQFQVSTNITAVIITFVSAVASSEEESVLSAVQLLWINIIMDTFAALALATDPASEASLDRKPDKKTTPLFTVDMYKQILGQSAYQTIITLIFHFLGARILGFHPTSDSTLQNKYDKTVQTLVFNIFVFAQIFNSINSRRLDNKLNIFQGVLRNYYFIGITLLEIGVQILIVFVGGAAFQVTPVGGREWGISLALGVVSIPLGALLRAIPNGPVERLFIKLRLLPRPELLPTSHDVEWNQAIDLVRDNLSTFSHVRGARMRASSYVDRSRKARTQPQQQVAMSSLMMMVPTLVASSIGAGWHPQSPQGLDDPAHFDPSKSSAALWENKIQIHPDTKPDDPAFKKWGHLKQQ